MTQSLSHAHSLSPESAEPSSLLIRAASSLHETRELPSARSRSGSRRTAGELPSPKSPPEPEPLPRHVVAVKARNNVAVVRMQPMILDSSLCASLFPVLSCVDTRLSSSVQLLTCPEARSGLSLKGALGSQLN